MFPQPTMKGHSVVLRRCHTRQFFLATCNATQRRFKLPFTIASCNTSSFQNNPTAGHTTTCICLQFYRSLQYLFHPNLRSKLQEKIASCYSAFKRVKTYLRSTKSEHPLSNLAGISINREQVSSIVVRDLQRPLLNARTRNIFNL